MAEGVGKMNAPTLRFRSDVAMPTTALHNDSGRKGDDAFATSAPWKRKQFHEVFSFLQNNTLSRDRLCLTAGSVKDIHYGDILVKFQSVIDPASQIVPFVADECDVKGQDRLRPGDVVIADTAEDETVGRAVEITGDNSFDVVAGLHTMPCHPTDTFASGFLGYYLNSPRFHDQLLPLIQGSKVSSISKSAICAVLIRYPAVLHEQQKIGSFFRSLDMLIDGREKALGKLESLKKAMLQKMFPQGDSKTPELRFKGFEGDWGVKRLGDIGFPYNGLSGKSKSDFGHGLGRYVTYMNVFSNPIANIAQCDAIEIDKGQNEVKDGDVFFTTSSETPEEVGMSSVWIGESENTYLNSFCFGYRPKPGNASEFLAYMFRSNGFRNAISFLAQGISRYNISKTKVMEIEVLLPKFEEQQKIGAYFRLLDALLAARREEVAKLRDLKKALLERMFV